MGVTADGIWLVIWLIGLSDTTRDYILQINVSLSRTHTHTDTQTLVFSVTVFTSLLVTASNGERASFFGFQDCPRASVTATFDWLTDQISTDTLIPTANYHGSNISTWAAERTPTLTAPLFLGEWMLG
jgi:hypothetical protein